MRSIFRGLVAVVLLALLCGCETWKLATVNNRSELAELWRENPPSLNEFYEVAGQERLVQGDAEKEARRQHLTMAAEKDLDEVYGYCAGIAQYEAQQRERALTIKNVIGTIGVIAGSIVAPVFAEGGAVRAWATVSGASVGALSRMFDGVAGDSTAGQSASTAQELVRQQYVISAEKDPYKKFELGRQLLLYCRLQDRRQTPAVKSPN